MYLLIFFIIFSLVFPPATGQAPLNNNKPEDSKTGIILAIVIIVILILLIIIDVIMFFAKNIGLTAFLVSKLTTKTSEKDKEAMIEDGNQKR